MKNRILLDPDSAINLPTGGAPLIPPVIPSGYIALTESNTFVEKARKEEKDKLYPKITELETGWTAAKEALKASELKVTELTAQLAAIGKARSTSDGKEVDVSKLVTEVTEQAVAAINKKHREEIASLSDKVSTFETQNKTLQLETLRRTLIEENGGSDRLIVSLIRGNNEEELRNSVSAAKTEYDRIVTKLSGSSPATSSANNGNVNASGNGGITPPPVIPNNSGGGDSNNAVNGSVASMDLKTYAAKRNALKQTTVGRYAGVR